MAGRNPDYVQKKVRTVILRKNGWNIDVPITSHYRQGAKRKRSVLEGMPNTILSAFHPVKNQSARENNIF